MARCDSQHNIWGKELCLLSLDGGGVRGLSSLLILRQIMEKISDGGPIPKPCEYFDMIGGTSTGGLIAIMLGRLEMSVDECIDAYMKLCPKVFGKTSSLRSLSRLFGRVKGRFDHEALEDGVKSILKSRSGGAEGTGLDESTLLKCSESSKCHVFVCASNKSQANASPEIFSSYKSDRRGSQMLDRVKIWEAVRATSAATSFFEPITIHGETFLDGATRANNPIRQLWVEATDWWKPSDQPSWRLEDNIKCLVSIGTGVPSVKAFGDSLISVGRALVAISTDCEQTAEDFRREHQHLADSQRYFRFNVTRGLQDIGIERADRLGEIQAATRTYCASEEIFHTLEQCSSVLKDRHDWPAEAIKQIREEANLWNTLSIQESRATGTLCYADSRWITNTKAWDKWLAGEDKDARGVPLDSILWVEDDEANDRKEGASITASTIYQELQSGTKWGLKGRPIIAYTNVSVLKQRAPNSEALNPYVLFSSLLSQLICIAAGSQSENISKWLNRLPEGLKSVCRFVWPGVNRAYDPSTYTLHTCYHLMHLLEYAVEFVGQKEIVLILDRTQKEAESAAMYEVMDCMEKPKECALPPPQTLPNYRCLIIVSSKQPVPLRTPLRLILKKSTEREECLASLNFSDIHERRSQISEPVKGTNLWMWQHPSYRAWLKEGGVIWIAGKPGSGKSVLAKTMLARISRDPSLLPKLTVGNGSSVIICDWFYSTRHGRVGISHLFMLRAILHNILSKRPDTFSTFLPAYRQERRAFPKQWTWSKEGLLSTLDRIIRQGFPILCLVDALDEAGGENDVEDSRKANLSLMSNLAVLENAPVPFIVLSRDVPDISQKFRYCRSICLEQENELDLERVIDSCLGSLKLMARKKLTDSEDDYCMIAKEAKRQPMNSSDSRIWTDQEIQIFENIRNHLLQNANGVMLWVMLVSKELHYVVQNKRGFTIAQLEETVMSLPTDLKDYYNYILRNIISENDPNSLKLSHRLLEWTIGASNHGPVTVQELWEVLVIPDDILASLKSETDPIYRNQIVIGDNWSRFKSILYYHCGPFLEIICPPSATTFYFDQESGTLTRDIHPTWIVQLLHKTAKDFLADSNTAGPLYVCTAEAEDNVQALGKRYLDICLPLVVTPYFPPFMATSNRCLETFNDTCCSVNIQYLGRHPLLYWIFSNWSLVTKGDKRFSSRQENVYLGSPELSITVESEVDSQFWLQTFDIAQLPLACHIGDINAVAILLKFKEMSTKKDDWGLWFVDMRRDLLYTAAEEGCPALLRVFVSDRQAHAPGLTYGELIGGCERAAMLGNKNAIRAICQTAKLADEAHWLREADLAERGDYALTLIRTLFGEPYAMEEEWTTNGSEDVRACLRLVAPVMFSPRKEVNFCEAMLPKIQYRVSNSDIYEDLLCYCKYCQAYD